MNDTTQLDTATINYLIDTTRTLQHDVDTNNHFNLAITLLMILGVMYLGFKKLNKK
jgi:hypothetical protein